MKIFEWNNKKTGDFKFYLDDNTFIPTQTTSAITEAAIETINTPSKVLDLGCGCGIVAILLSKNLPFTLDLYASDLSDTVEEIVNMNAAKHNVEIDVRKSDIFETWHGFKFNTIINDISGLKYDKNMKNVISKFQPSLILCAYDSKTILGNSINSTKKLFKSSLKIAKDCQIPDKKIVLDPAIGFFRKTGKGKFFTKIKTDWVDRDLSIIKNLNSFKMKYPILISVSNKSLIGNLLQKENPSDRLFGSITAEAICVLNGANIIRTHNVMATRDAITIATKLSK